MPQFVHFSIKVLKRGDYFFPRPFKIRFRDGPFIFNIEKCSVCFPTNTCGHALIANAMVASESELLIKKPHRFGFHFGECGRFSLVKPGCKKFLEHRVNYASSPS